MKSSTEEGDLGIMVVEKLDMRQHDMFASQSKPNPVLHQKKLGQQVKTEGLDWTT